MYDLWDIVLSILIHRICIDFIYLIKKAQFMVSSTNLLRILPNVSVIWFPNLRASPSMTEAHTDILFHLYKYRNILYSS